MKGTHNHKIKAKLGDKRAEMRITETLFQGVCRTKPQCDWTQPVQLDFRFDME